jgi:P4 family phage/plasmid primase-like protien
MDDKTLERIESGATMIYYDGDRFAELVQKYPAFAKKLRVFLDDKLCSFREHPFKYPTKDVFIQEIKENIEFHNPNAIEEKVVVEEKNIKKSALIFTREAQIEEFWKDNPFFYDRSKMFFIWNKEEYKYEMSDTVDLLNSISDVLGLDTINSKVRGELTSGFEQVGRRHIPEKAPLSWVQFKKTIYDFKTDRVFEAEPKYFITNPIPYDLGESDATPNMDRLFNQWVDEKWVKTLYQVIAHSTTSFQFMQRLIALHGGGSNGKGTFMKLLKRFLGEDNICTSELKELVGSGFETSSIYKKLVCFMGEVSYDDLKNTNQIKKLSGEDDIRFCFKGKTPFTDKSITTLISATNSMPRTPDKTMGFYRKWLIIDFPNQFTTISKDLIENIPDYEFSNLARKILNILKELYKTQQFDNEGDFEERMNRYEERSNPIQKFIENNCVEINGEKIELKIFANIFNDYAKTNHLRILSVRQISKILKEDGFELGSRSVENDGNKSTKYFILNISLKTNETNETNVIPSRFLHEETILNSVSSVSSVSFEDKKSSYNPQMSLSIGNIGVVNNGH